VAGVETRRRRTADVPALNRRLVKELTARLKLNWLPVGRGNLKNTVGPEDVFNYAYTVFHVGGYQPCQKWLKDRKGRALSYDDMQHYRKIVVALAETIRVMAEIDAVIPAWPLK
jgi:hypothetical protein